jgi:L-fuconolactonase
VTPEPHRDLVVDAHQHIWDPARADYPWLRGAYAPIARRYGFEELRPELDEVGVHCTVLVQASDDLADTALMLECAAREPRVVGVVATAPLESPERTAEALAGYRDDPVVVGIRTLIHDQPDPRWLLREEVGRSLALVEAAGLAFDVVAVLPEHLECALAVAERLPGLRLVLDHLGHPPMPDGGDDRWWDLVARLAEHAQVAAKVSGLYPPGDPPVAERTARIRPAFEHAVRCFGADRLLYGGDWPVSALHGGYAVTWASLQPLLAELPAADRRAVLGGTAVATYRLDAARLDAARRAVAVGTGSAAPA